MLVTLLTEEGMSSLLLPDKIRGRYWVQNWENGKRLISIEGSHGRWKLDSNKEVQILDDMGNNMISTKLQPCNLYSIKETETNTMMHIFAEPVTQDWKRYTIHGEKDIYIGRSERNSICICNIAVSAIHARLLKEGDKWVIYDHCSRNGIYVNNRRVHGACLLKPGDMVYIMGFRIIVGKGFLAMNNAEHSVRLDKTIFFPFKRRKLIQNGEKGKVEPDYYYRSPRSMEIDAYLTMEQCKEIIAKGKNTLWERRWSEADFLKIRVGKENTVLDLKTHSIAGITGNRADNLAFVKGILLQMVTYFGFDEFKIVLLLDEETKKEFQTIRWLPHVWDDRKRHQLIATNICEGKKLYDYLKQEGKKRGLPKGNRKENAFPYYLVLVFHDELADQINISGLLEDLKGGMLYITDEKNHLPKECTGILEIREDSGYLLDRKNKTKRYFIPDIYVRQNIDLCYLQLANIELDLKSGKNESAMWRIVELYLPAVGKSYDIRILRNRRIREMIPLLEKEMKERTGGYFSAKNDTVLCERECGIVLNMDETPEEIGILNGTKLMLI